MRAISLWEPWATAIAVGAKKIETRGWPTSYRGPLAIHAAKTRAHVEFLFTIHAEPLRKEGITLVEHLAFGCVVATCRLEMCVRTEHARRNLSDIELGLGNYEDGRFAWMLKDVVRLPKPIPARGARMFWDWQE